MAETLCEFAKRELGTDKWVVAPRMTARLHDKGYTHAISQKRYKALADAWEAQEYGAPLKSLRNAAPDLLRAARALLEWGRDNTSPRDPDSPHALLIAIHEAIAKAEGKTP